MEKDEKKIEKNMQDINTSWNIIKQKLKSDTTRFYTPIVHITERERRQFNQGNCKPNINAILIKKARNAIKVAEDHIREESLKQEKSIIEKEFKSIKTSTDISKETKNGGFDFSFDALIVNPEDL